MNGKFGVTYSVSWMNDLLHSLGYTYKKPKLVPGKSDKERQEEFLVYYEKFMLQKPENEAVYFMDGVHPEHNTLASYGWLRKGENRELKSNTGRQRINLHGAINIETLELELIESDKINSESILLTSEFLAATSSPRTRRSRGYLKKPYFYRRIPAFAGTTT